MSWLDVAGGVVLRAAWWSYWLGVAYWLGAARGERGSWVELAAVLAWPPLRLYGLVWGAPSHRRWFCALAGHDWRETVRGGRTVHPAPGVAHHVTLMGRQCRRCWRREP